MSTQPQDTKPKGFFQSVVEFIAYLTGGYVVLSLIVTALSVILPIIALVAIVSAFCGGGTIINQMGEINQLTFAGKVVNEEMGEWPNNRLVILYLNEKEIGRATTQRAEFQLANTGIEDGLFAIVVDNPYRLTQAILEEDRTEDPRFQFAKPFFQDNFAYLWVDKLGEGSTIEIPIPSKNITYVIKAIEGDISELPTPLVENSTALTDNGTIIIAPKADDALSSTPQANNEIFLQNVTFNPVTEEIELSKLVFPINNCAGNVRLSQQYSESKTFIHEYHFEVEGKMEAMTPTLFGLLFPQLQARYGFENGEVETKTFNYELAAEPGTGVSYTITYKEIWEVGTADIKIGNDLLTVPFRVKKTVIQQIDTEKITCN